MDTLPLETLQRIFELACTDGGYTGHALSLVSKSIRAAARTTRFHSVALIASPYRLQLFVDMYERACDPAHGDKPRIQHLYVAFPSVDPGRVAHDASGANVLWPLTLARSLEPRPSPLAGGNVLTIAQVRPVRGSAGDAFESTASTSTAREPQSTSQRNVRPSIWTKLISTVSRYRKATRKLLPGRRHTSLKGSATSRHDHRSTSPEHLSSAYQEYLSAAQKLFRLVASDLVTLVVQCGFTYGGQLILPIVERPFPRLSEVAFVGVADPRVLLSDSDGTEDTPLFPATTHLHVVPAFSHGSGFCLPFWATHAPGLTHLSVSRADDYLNEIAGAMGVWVKPEPFYDPFYDYGSVPGAPSTPAEPPLNLAPTYPSVRHLLLQPSPRPIRSCCGNGWLYHAQRMRVLRQVESSCQAIGVEVVEAEPLVGGTFLSYYEQARSRWLERIDDNGDEAGGWSG